MKKTIKLVVDVPVSDEHGMIKDRELVVTRDADEHSPVGVRWYVMGDAGKEVGVFGREAVIIDEPD